jgi:hypothetical protein
MTAIPPEDPPDFVTGRLLCCVGGIPTSGIPVDLQILEAPAEPAGLCIDGAPLTVVSDANGVVEFTLYVGAVYQIRAGKHGAWRRFTIPSDASSTFAMPDIVAN